MVGGTCSPGRDVSTLLSLVFLSTGCFLSPVDGEAGEDSGGSAGPTGLEAEVHDLVNAHRETLGLLPFGWSEEAAVEARGHNENMVAGVVPLGHDGFDDRVAVLSDLLALAGAGENVAWLLRPLDPAADAVEGWLNSEGHRANIEGDFDIAGVGVYEENEEYWMTQIFVKLWE